MKKKLIILLFFILTLAYLEQVFHYIVSPIDINNYYASNSLINYSAGFVRRGISGEIIKFISQNTNIGVLNLLKITNVFLFFLIVLYFFREFIKKNISLFFILLPYTLFYLFKEQSVNLKDLISLVIFILINKMLIYGQKKIFRYNRFYQYFVINILAIIGVLNHEMFFFLFLPSVILMYCCLDSDFSLKNIGFQLLLFFPVIIAFLITSLYIGSPEQSQIIFNDIARITHSESVTNQFTSKIEFFLIPMFKTFSNGFSRGVIYLVFFIFIIYLLSNFDKILFSFRDDNDKKIKTLDSTLLLFSFMVLNIFFIPLYILAFDWFRFLNMSLLFSLIIGLTLFDFQIKLPFIVYKIHQWIKNKFDFFIISNINNVLFVAMFCIIPHYKFGNTYFQFSNTFIIVINFFSKLISIL